MQARSARCRRGRSAGSAASARPRAGRVRRAGESCRDEGGGRSRAALAHVDPATLVGSGKAHEIAERAEELDADVVFVFNDLRPRQRTNLEKMIPLPIVDRTMLILDIFAQHARSREGQLQVELAQLRYRQSNLIGAGAALSRLGGGVGTRGPGETKLEVDRRKIQQRVSLLQRQLDDVRKQRETRRAGRGRDPFVALVGYTNVGKSSLLNRLAGSGRGEGAFVADQPFATLDPTLRRAYVAPELNVRLADTVGFITALPQELVNAFRATLEELDERRSPVARARRGQPRLAAPESVGRSDSARAQARREAGDRRLQQGRPPRHGGAARGCRRARWRSARRPAKGSTRCAPRSPTACGDEDARGADGACAGRGRGRGGCAAARAPRRNRPLRVGVPAAAPVGRALHDEDPVRRSQAQGRLGRRVRQRRRRRKRRLGLADPHRRARGRRREGSRRDDRRRGACAPRTSSRHRRSRRPRDRRRPAARIRTPRGSAASPALEPGTPIGVLGYPIPDAFEDEQLGRTVSLYTGRVASVRKGALELDVPIIPGESGGPVFDAGRGEVIGIAESRFDEERAIGFATPIDTATRFLASHPRTPPRAARAPLVSLASSRTARTPTLTCMRTRERSPIQRAGGMRHQRPSRRAVPRSARASRRTRARRRRAGAAGRRARAAARTRRRTRRTRRRPRRRRQAEEADEVAHEVRADARVISAWPRWSRSSVVISSVEASSIAPSVPTHDSSSWLERKYVSTG